MILILLAPTSARVAIHYAHSWKRKNEIGGGISDSGTLFNDGSLKEDEQFKPDEDKEDQKEKGMFFLCWGLNILLCIILGILF